MPSQPTKLVSVLMPTFNEKEAYLRLAIESVLAQTFTDFEFLIINDGSTLEHCQKIIDEYAAKDSRIRPITHEKNLFLIATLNHGLELAQGKYVARLDSDDIAEPQRLEKQLDFMQKNPDCVLCGTWAHFIDMQGKKIGSFQPATNYQEIKKRIIDKNFFVHSSWFFQKDVIKSYGGYANYALRTEDYDLLLRMIPHHQVAILPEFLVSYRMNLDGICFGQNKATERTSIYIRYKAIKEYGYPKKYYYKLIYPTLRYLLVPFWLKKIIFKILWKK